MNKSKILRKFPYPFKCALAICSDIDATTSVERFVELQKFLCTDEQTSVGAGISLEIGNSFWFFRNSDHLGISYFSGLSSTETDFAPVCRKLIKAGFIDVLHTYGDFNSGGFNRKYADLSINELIKQNLKIKTWVNHGNDLNAQNIGKLSAYCGADLTSEHYHLELLTKYGIKYFWISQLTHLVGQDSKKTFNNTLKNQLQKLLAVKYYGKQENPFFSNQLMKRVLQKDGKEVNAFMRFINPWGKYSYTDAANLPNQLNAKILEELKNNEGYLILYTHLGNYNNPQKILPDQTVKTLQNLSQENESGNIFVTTTTRLLTYYEVISLIIVDVKMNGDKRIINISFKENFLPLADDLSGLSFYTNNPENTFVYFNNTQLKTISNSADYTGRLSVSIPWKKLMFPHLF